MTDTQDLPSAVAPRHQRQESYFVYFDKEMQPESKVTVQFSRNREKWRKGKTPKGGSRLAYFDKMEPGWRDLESG